MYLRTPKRYTQRGRKRNLLNLTWLWLYLIAPPIIIGSALAWNFRADLSRQIGDWAGKNIRPPSLFQPTPTATLPAKDLEVRILTALENGSINDALSALISFTASVPNDRAYHNVLAETLIMRNPTDPRQRKQAYDAAQSAIAASPETPEGWISMALVLDWSDDSARALSYALRARELGDTTGMASAVMGGIYVSLNDFPQATKLADEAIRQNPRLAYARYVKGQIAQYSGNPKEAIQWYREALAIWQDDRRQWSGYIAVALAGVYSGQNQDDLAIRTLNEAIPRDKDYPGLAYQLSNIYYKQGEYQKALETSQACNDRAPEYASCYMISTRVYYQDGLFEKATQAAERAIELGLKETSVFYYGGEAYRKLNRCPDAIKLFNAGFKVAEERKREDIKSQFTSVLADCGIVADSQILASPTPELSPTPTRRK